MEQENNLVEKALAILHRQPKKLEALIEADRERAATLAAIRQLWHKLGVDVDARRKAKGLSSLGDHLERLRQPTPLVDALLAEIDASPKVQKIYDRAIGAECIESSEPGITPGDVFRMF